MIRSPHAIPLVLVLAAACSGSNASAAEVDPCLPGDTEAVLSVNVRQLLDAPVVKKHFRSELETLLRREDFRLAPLIRAAQIDPLKDIRSLTAGFRAPAEWVVVLRGTFDPAKVHAALDKMAKIAPDVAKLHKQEGQRIYQVGGRFGYFPDRETLVIVSSRDGLRAASARKDEKKAATFSRELRGLLDKVDGTQSIWLAAVASASWKQSLGGVEVQKLLSQVQGLRGGVTVGDDVQAAFRIEMDDGRAAGEVRKAVDALKGILILAAANHEKYGDLIADFVSALKPTSDKDGVTVKGGLSAAEIEKRAPKTGKDSR